MVDAATVRLFAAARSAADGVSEVPVTPGTLQDVTTYLIAQYPALSAVLPHCSIVIDGAHGTDETVVSAGSTIDVLPPFAGG